VYINVHHIIQEASGGENSIENAIVLCLRCHGEVGHYNNEHPIGNKYSSSELRGHRDKWWGYCEKNPTKTLPSRPITISPNAFRLIVGKWRTKVVIKISNKSDEILYDISIKFSVRIAGIDISKIRIAPRKKDFIQTHRLDNYEIAGDYIRYDGIDCIGLSSCILVIKSIDPNEVLTFFISNTVEETPAPQHNQHVVISLLGYSDEPIEMLIQDGKLALPIRNYEGFEVSKIHLLMSR
jgi:hypothetical protein